MKESASLKTESVHLRADLNDAQRDLIRAREETEGVRRALTAAEAETKAKEVLLAELQEQIALLTARLERSSLGTFA